VPDVQPAANDTVVISVNADKFFNTNLDDVLKQGGITNVVMVGTFSNGAVLYTAFEAAARGYTVVVAEDGLSAPTDFATFVTEWQLLNGPGTANLQNTPLQPKAVTLSRTDLITYK
ncbi:MAG TPA: isochorismatase family protein, partial [Dehalococcoidia bacterium]|nr:isochorismatase family protein [Dehalococcoidia bacterium]